MIASTFNRQKLRSRVGTHTCPVLILRIRYGFKSAAQAARVAHAAVLELSGPPPWENMFTNRHPDRLAMLDVDPSLRYLSFIRGNRASRLPNVSPASRHTMILPYERFQGSGDVDLSGGI